MIKSSLIYLFFSGLFFVLNQLNAQELLFDHGEIEFYTATTISDIEAITEEASIKLDVKTGNVDIAVNIKSFDFEYELMETHFNREYMESDKFPQATFKGKIIQDISGDFEVMDVDVSGDLTIHGVTRKIDVKAQITKSQDYVLVKAKMPVVFENYNIEEPTILTKAVAKSVEVKSTLYLK